MSKINYSPLHYRSKTKNKPFVCLRDDGNIRIVVYSKGKGDQQILTDKHNAQIIMNRIKECLN